jgi:transcription elongation GreA/GreB family factor
MARKRLREIDRRIRFLIKRLEIAVVADPALHFGQTQIFFGAAGAVCRRHRHATHSAHCGY